MTTYKVNAEARHEQTTFLAALAATPHLEFALKYIKAHARDPRAKHVQTMPELMKLLKDIWFTPYRRWPATTSEIATPSSRRWRPTHRDSAQAPERQLGI